MLTCDLGGDRHLRAFEEADAERLYAAVEANRDYLAQWMPWAPDQTLERTVEFIRAAREQQAANQGLQYAIVERGEIVGTIGYHAIDWRTRWTTVGYWLTESAQGHGTMTAAVAALVDHAFATWELNRVEIHADLDNHRSRAVPERLGFTMEGVLRQRGLVGGRLGDLALYSLLAEEWDGRPGRAG